MHVGNELQRQKFGMHKNGIRVNKYISLSLSLCPHFFLITSSPFSITNCTQFSHAAREGYILPPFYQPTARTTRRTARFHFAQTHTGFYYFQAVIDSSYQRDCSFILMDLTDVCICVCRRETR